MLGRLRVTDGEHDVELGGQRDRSLLARLLIDAGTVVSADRLLEDVWGRRDATPSLHAAVFRLRRILELDRPPRGVPQVLVRHSAGYLLAVPDEHIDARRFQKLIVEAQMPGQDEAVRSDLWDRAFELWQGPDSVLADVMYSDFAQPEVRRLNELGAVVQEERIDIRLGHGLHRDVIADLEALVVEYPLRARMYGQLMLALYRSGRRTEALRVGQEARNAFGAGSGSELGHDLGRLEAAILREDPALDYGF